MASSKPAVQTLPPPPGIIGSLRAGFDAIATHIGLILLPLGMDLLLWLGPRVAVNRLMQPVLDELSRLAPTTGSSAADVAAMVDIYRELLQRFNLLVALRTVPIGVFSLMSGKLPVLSPLGQPAILQVDDYGQLLGLFMMLTLVGWVLGGLYFYRVARLVISSDAGGLLPTPGRAVAQTIAYSIIWMALLWTLGMPALFIVYLSFGISSLLGQTLVIFLSIAAFWLLVPLFFSPHGMYVKRQNALASFLGGFQLTRFTLPSSGLFVLAVVVVGAGLNILWAVPSDASGLALVGILGHAFITTALLAASFIYYQQMSAWLQLVLERLRTGIPAQQA